MRFQSPCAGNMFGKHEPERRASGDAADRGFQSPCAGNMFGKLALHGEMDASQQGLGFNPRVRGTCLVRSSCMSRKRTPCTMFQSPCAGNMFGKVVVVHYKEQILL